MRIDNPIERRHLCRILKSVQHSSIFEYGIREAQMGVLIGHITRFSAYLFFSLLPSLGSPLRLHVSSILSVLCERIMAFVLRFHRSFVSRTKCVIIKILILILYDVKCVTNDSNSTSKTFTYTSYIIYIL